MTAQVSDKLFHECDEYDIAAVEKAWPFRPEDHGFQPYPSNTACRRGYYARYAIVDGALILDALNVTVRVGHPPPWRGIQPRQGEFWKYDRSWTCEGVALPIRYSGGVIVGRDFLREFYVHMGFHRPHCFAVVLELFFDDGQLRTDVVKGDARGEPVGAAGAFSHRAGSHRRCSPYRRLRARA